MCSVMVFLFHISLIFFAYGYFFILVVVVRVRKVKRHLLRHLLFLLELCGIEKFKNIFAKFASVHCLF